MLPPVLLTVGRHAAAAAAGEWTEGGVGGVGQLHGVAQVRAGLGGHDVL